MGHRKATKLQCPDRITSGKTRDTFYVRDHVQPGRLSQFWACGEGIFFRMDPTPFVPAWQLDKSPELGSRHYRALPAARF